MRNAVARLLGLILRIFFPRIELSGLDRVPARGPVILVVNHPNGLIDPLFLLCLSPRPVSFLAKAPLFTMPVIGWFVRALGSIPVYRRQDRGFDPEQNRQTFERARSILGGGGVIALFPEGASHSDPKLRPLKTGAARIALGATSVAGREESLRIVPVGLYYTAKGTFRSAALLYFGEPIVVEPIRLGPDGEPPADAVGDLTARLERALSDVTLQADEHEAMALVARAERVFSSEEPAPGEGLIHQFELRRRFLAGYSALRTKAPQRLAAVLGRIARYEAGLGEAGLDPATLSPRGTAPEQSLRDLLRSLAFFILLLPTALLGTVLHYPAYRLVGVIATGASRRDDDVLATSKVLAGALLFPLTWVGVAVTIGLWWGVVPGVAALLVAPLSGYAALSFFERLDQFAGGLKALIFSRFRRRGFLRLVAERRAIREEILQLAAELEG